MASGQNAEVEAAVAATHARDRAAFRSLGARAQVAAIRLGMLGFWLRRWLGDVCQRTLRGSERILGAVLERAISVADKIIFGPYRVLRRGLAVLFHGIGSGLKAASDGLIGAASLILRGIEAGLGWVSQWFSPRRSAAGTIAWIEVLRRRLGRSQLVLKVIRRRWRRAIDLAWRWLQAGAGEVLVIAGQSVRWIACNLLYRPCAWIFNPRLPGGRPLLISEGLTRFAGFVLAAVALYLGAALLAYIKTKALVLHGSINSSLWRPDASHMANLAMLGGGHAAIAIGVALSKFVLLPVLAAARRGMKNNRFTQAIAYQYARRLRVARQRESVGMATEPATAATTAAVALKKPLRFLETLVQHIMSGTVPEAYEVKPGLKRTTRGH